MLRTILSWVLLLLLSVCVRHVVAAQVPSQCSASILSVQAAPGSAHAPDTYAPDQGWVSIQLPDDWALRWPDHSGSVWYRIQWATDCDPTYLRAHPLALAIDSISMAGQVFLGEDLIWQDTHLVEPLSRSWNMPRVWTLPAAAIGDGVNTILVQVRGAAISKPGLGLVRLDTPETLRHRQRSLIQNHRSLFTINIMGSLAITFLFLAMWLFYRKAVLYLWFVLLNLCWVVFLYNVTATETWPFPSTAVVMRVNAIALMAFCLCFISFIFHLARRPLPRALASGVAAFTVLMSAWIAWAPDGQLLLALKVGIRGHLLLFAVACLVLVWMALRSRKLEDWLYGGVGLFYVVVAVHDWRVFYLKLNAAPLTPYANLVTMTGISIIMGLRIAHSMRRIERFNEELKVTVEKACIELEQSLEKKHELALTTTKLQERVELIQDIHDGFGSALVRAIAQAESDQSGDRQKSRHISTLKSLRDDLRLVIDSGRHFSDDVPCSPQVWLASTRYQFSSLFDNIGMESHWQLPAKWNIMPSAMACLTMTRFLEEALSNVLKHSQASEVRVSMVYPVPERIVLEVFDNGIGFDVTAARNAAIGVGMGSMRARIEKLGGHVEIHSRRGSTLVRGVLPVHPGTR